MNFLRFKNLSEFGNIKHGISTRSFGSMKNEDGSLSKENLEKFIIELNLPKAEVCMHQIHGGDVAVVTDNKIWQIQNADGLVTDKKNIPLSVVVADCLPVLFYDPKKEAVGIGHGGRKGLGLNILGNVVNKLVSEFGSDPKDILIGIGPGIEKKCYEVDGDFIDIFQLAFDQLEKKGIEKKNIEVINICTKDNMDIFYSYRGGNVNGRFASVISLI